MMEHIWGCKKWLAYILLKIENIFDEMLKITINKYYVGKINDTWLNLKYWGKINNM